MNILFIGDIVGRAGRRSVRKFLPQLQNNYNPQIIIANGENAAGGFGITRKVAEELFDYGIDCITMGNHTWNNKDIFNFIDEESRLIRPLNYLPGNPGKGWTVLQKEDFNIAIVNLQGQIYMENINSPLMTFEQHITSIQKKANIIVVDFHAEATGEKNAFASYVDGKVSCVCGTHTHIQTADERILNEGTAYITDLGFSGAIDSILGMKKEGIIKKFRTQLPVSFKVGTGNVKLEGAIIDIDQESGLARNIKRIQLKE